MKEILREVEKERNRQDEKFGCQEHMPERWLAILTEEVGEVAKAVCEMRYADEATENRYDELKAHHINNYREELIQVAAVCVAMIESLERGNV